jgi:hypothetical protein
MKRSTKVALTLLVPAMAAYGCGNQSTTAPLPAATQRQGTVASAKTMTVVCQNGHSFPVDSRSAGQTVTCPSCEQKVIVPAATTSPSTRHRPRGGWTMWWFGDHRSRSGSYVPPPDTQERNVTRPSTVARGGFGGTGSFFSGVS